MAKKKRQIGTEGPADIGMVLTVSLFLILLTFFILLNSIAVMDENRVRVALGSLIGAFGGLPGGLSPLATGEDILPPSAPLVEEELSIDQLLVLMNKTAPVMAGEIKFHEIEAGVIVSISEKELFTKDRTGINPKIYPFLNKLAGIIKRDDFPVEIVGHTDTGVAKKKKYKSNWEQSALMALKVLKHFEKENAIPPLRFTSYGHGGHKPIASNKTLHSRAANRRVEVILKYKAPEYVKRISPKKSTRYFTYKKFDFKLY